MQLAGLRRRQENITNNRCRKFQHRYRGCRLRNAQQYHVSPFRPSALYGGRDTYIYHAAIRALDQDAVVGGIGIVFDAEPELRNMLAAGLAGKERMSAFYVNREFKTSDGYQEDVIAVVFQCFGAVSEAGTA